MEKQKVYKRIATHFTAYENCIKSGNEKWESIWFEKLNDIVDDHLPSGSGIDNGNQFDWGRSKQDRLVIYSGYHTMNENGYYGRWIDYTVTITPSLLFDFEIKISGKFGNDQDLKDYLYDVYNESLSQIID